LKDLVALFSFAMALFNLAMALFSFVMALFSFAMATLEINCQKTQEINDPDKKTLKNPRKRLF